ncbi:hypothetical protein [Rubrivirga litoralis]|uniref:ABC transporter permease n=1 Tax=Rubrivirga litoralis TaxID=3075598 RepID=A0ABU3BTV0_9BACT|nr:hypothetical protein [Rubrivirga sp. F394]MDT0632718.1 hypothetical protein [Rubrivirga sp. F394]
MKEDVPTYLARRARRERTLSRVIPAVLLVVLIVFVVVVLHYVMGHGPLSPWLPGQ